MERRQHYEMALVVGLCLLWKKSEALGPAYFDGQHELDTRWAKHDGEGERLHWAEHAPDRHKA